MFTLVCTIGSDKRGLHKTTVASSYTKCVTPLNCITGREGAGFLLLVSIGCWLLHGKPLAL